MTHGSLFSGIGGFDLAAEWAGFQNLFHCEWNPFCRQVLKHHFPKSESYEDITKTDFTKWRGKIDILTGGFPCFVAGTPVLTRKGFLPIKDVCIGDEVLSADRQYHAVECLMRHDAEDIVYLRAQGMFQELKCTPNHPFYVRRIKNRRYLEAEYVHAGNLKKGDKVGYPVYEGNDTSFTPQFWKLIGTWLADGWVDNGKRSSRIPQGTRGSRINSFNHKVIICCGKHHISRLHHVIQKAGYKYTLSEGKSTYRAIICNKELVEFLKDFGKYAHGKHLSPQCFMLDNTRKRALIEGWLSDGYVEKNGSMCITTVSERLAMDMAQIARDVYRSPVSIRKTKPNRICKIEGRMVNERPTYRITIPKSSKYCFYEDGFVWCNVKSIRKEKEKNEVFNLSVNEEHSYNVYGIAVHNCQPFSVAGSRKGAEDDRYLWPQMLRAIEEIRPTWVIGENVAGILTMVLPGEEIEVGSYTDITGESYKEIEERQLYVVERICQDFEHIGYSVQPIVIPACAVGAPHRRDRVWFIASNRDSARFQTQGTEQQTTGIAGGSLQRDVANAKSEQSKQYELEQSSSCKQEQGKFRRSNSKTYLREIGNWDNSPTTEPAIRSGGDGISLGLAGISFSKWRQESIKSLGNAIVPQVAYEIFKAIKNTITP